MASQDKSVLSCKLLPNDVQNVIRSGVVISNVVRCVEELVLNSIDAGGTIVNVTINLDNFRIKVEDNGHGISREDLEVLGTRYMTSKCQSLTDLANLETYGFRGESLASIIDVSSAVEFISKSKTSTFCCAYRRKFKNGNATDIQTVNDDVIKSNGFIAIVHGLLEKQPVRRQRIDKITEVEEIKSCLESINLINPSVIITIRDDSTGALLLRTIVAESVLDYFKKICQRKQNVLEQRLMDVAFTQLGYSVSGFVSQDWYPTKSLQYVYINKRLVVKSKVNKMLNQKLTPLLGCHSSSSQKFSQTTALRAKFAKKNFSRAVGPAEKFPLFVVNISCPPSQVDMIYEPSKTHVNFVSNEDLTELVETLVCQVEAQINLSEQIDAPGVNKSLPQKPVIDTEKKSIATNHSSILGKRKMMSVNSVGTSDPKPVLGAEMDFQPVIQSRVGTLLQNEEIGDAPRTGLERGRAIEDDLASHKWQENSFENITCGKYFQRSEEPEKVDEPKEQDDDWDISFQEEESEIPIFSNNTIEINMWRKKVDTSLPVPCRFSKEDLARIVVIGNVDHKFIAAKVTMRRAYDLNDIQETEMLVLFDQHAVHERICLERLIGESLEDIVNGEKAIVSVQIDPPLQMHFTDTEVKVMESNDHGFSLLGLQVKIVGPNRVKFLAIPKCFADKVIKEPILTREKVVQRLLQSLVQDQVRYIMQTNGAVQTLSRTIMDVLRSQACRGAIKFGDELSFEASVHLINDLKTCQAPFQCAHGRPVLVPLLDLQEVK